MKAADLQARMAAYLGLRWSVSHAVGGVPTGAGSGYLGAPRGVPGGSADPLFGP